MKNRSSAIDPAELRAIPATNGTRINGTSNSARLRKYGNRTKALSDCISYNVSDPDNVKTFSELKNPRKLASPRKVSQRIFEAPRDTRPEVLRYNVGYIGNVE